MGIMDKLFNHNHNNPGADPGFFSWDGVGGALVKWNQWGMPQDILI